MFDQNFNVGMDWYFTTAKWNVQSTMGNLHFTNSQTSVMMGSSDVQRLTLRSNAGCKRHWWHWSCWRIRSDPFDVAMTQNFKCIFQNFLTIVCDIASMFAWQNFGWNLITWEKFETNITMSIQCICVNLFTSLPGASHVNWGSILIVSSQNRTFRQWRMNCTCDPGC